MSGWQELAGSWALLATFALLVLAVVTANTMADTHPALGRWRDAAVRAGDRAAARVWELAQPRAAALLRATVDATERSRVAVRRIIEEQRSAGRHSAAADTAADLTAPTAATS